MIKAAMNPKLVIRDFDKYLEDNGESFSAIVIGATALSILGVVNRQTQDVDVLDPRIPESIRKLAVDFVTFQARKGISLEPNWLNNGPQLVTEILDPGWKSRLQILYQGKALTLQTLGRVDFLGTKLDAMCQRGDDFDDIVRMKPTKEELEKAVIWVKKQDVNPGWPNWVDMQAKKIAEALSYAL